MCLIKEELWAHKCVKPPRNNGDALPHASLMWGVGFVNCHSAGPLCDSSTGKRESAFLSLFCLFQYSLWPVWYLKIQRPSLHWESGLTPFFSVKLLVYLYVYVYVYAIILYNTYILQKLLSASRQCLNQGCVYCIFLGLPFPLGGLGLKCTIYVSPNAKSLGFVTLGILFSSLFIKVQKLSLCFLNKSKLEIFKDLTKFLANFLEISPVS